MATPNVLVASLRIVRASMLVGQQLHSSAVLLLNTLNARMHNVCRQLVAHFGDMLLSLGAVWDHLNQAVCYWDQWW